MIVLFFVTVLILIGAYFYSQQTRIKKHMVNNTPQNCTTTNLKECKLQADCNLCNDTMLCTHVTVKKPYTYKKDGKTINVQNGKYCLPPKAKDLKCNHHSGTQVLTFDPYSKQYLWRCECNSPLIVTNDNVYSDCVNVVACNGGKLVCPDKSPDCKSGSEWKDSPTWNPADGICKCGKGMKYISGGGKKYCVEDVCSPGTTFNDTCKCPSNKTPDKHNHWKTTIVKEKRCIDDPCNPNGYFLGRTCKCANGTIPIQDALSVTGWRCDIPCRVHNPCGAKGTCVYKDEKYQCKNCVSPYYQTKDQLCSGIKKGYSEECKSDVECLYGNCSAWNAPISDWLNGKKYCGDTPV